MYSHFNMKILIFIGLIYGIYCETNTDFVGDPLVTHTVTFEIHVREQRIGIIEFGLFGRLAPKSVKNFVDLSNKPVTEGYKKSTFHAVIPNTIIVGGDYINFDGSGGCTVYGKYFVEKPKLKYYGPGWLSTYSKAEDEQSSTFGISTGHISCKTCVVFGKVLKGMKVLREIEKLPKSGNRVRVPLEIAECSGKAVSKPFTVPKVPATEDT